MGRSWVRGFGESAHPARVDHVHRNSGLAQPAGQQPFVAARWFTDGQGGVVLFAQLGDACCGVVETQHRATGDRNVQVGLAHVNADITLSQWDNAWVSSTLGSERPERHLTPVQSRIVAWLTQK